MVIKKIETRDYLRTFITRANKEAGVIYNASKLNSIKECEDYLLNLVKNLRHNKQDNKAYIKEINELKEEIEILNDEQQEEVVQDFINSLKSFYGVSTILETHIWEHGKDKEKINLNKLKNYKSISYATAMAQLGKVREEYQELLNEVEIKNDDFRYVKNRDNFVAEALDLATATINLLLLCKVSDVDFNKHIEKLNAYKNGKYKK